ncbi:MAG: hypothetical protein QXD25_02480 [Nanopusillaceae archaeon]
MVKTQFGLTTLIIFIAMIVTAAIAAGVIIYTTQTLQQRALQVGAQARERVATGVEVVRVFGYQYDINKQILNRDLQAISLIAPVIRLMSGSRPISFSRISYILTTGMGDVYAYQVGNKLPTAVYVTLQGGSYLVYGFLFNDAVDVKNVTSFDVRECSIIKAYDGGYIEANVIRDANNTVIGCWIALKSIAVDRPLRDIDILNMLFELKEAGIASPFAIVGIQLSQISPFIQEGDLYQIILYLGKYLPSRTRYTLQIIPQEGYIVTIDGFVPTVLTSIFEDIWAAG